MFKELNILKVFLEHPGREFNVREIARLIKKAPATVSKELKGFAKNGVLKERKDRRFNFYKANLDNGYYKDIKIFYTLRKIKESGVIESLNSFYGKPTIIFFGSGAHGIDTETSDYDLVVISEKTKEFHQKEKYEKILKRDIQMFILKELKDLKNKHLINNVLNGIVIQGEIKWT